MEVEDEFIVNLQEHAGAIRTLVEELRDADHRDLDHISSRALDGRVDRGALGGGADHAVLGVDVAEVAAAAGEGLDVAVALGLGDRFILESLHPGILAEVFVDHFLGAATGEFAIEPLRETEGGNPVDDAEIHHLRRAAHLRGDAFQRHTEDARGGRGVNVLTRLEGLDHRGISAERSHHPQLDLRIVGGKDHKIRAARHESAPDLASLLGTDRNVLQVRIVRGEAAGRGEELVEGRVDAPGAGKDGFGEGVDVGAFQLRGLAVGKHIAHDLMLGGKSGEGLLVGLILSGLGLFGFVVEAESFEEDLADLLRRIEVEGHAGGLEDGLFIIGDAGREDLAGLREGCGIDADAFLLHRDEDGDEGAFDLDEDAFLPGLVDLLPQDPGELPGDVGILGGILHDLRERGASLRGRSDPAHLGFAEEIELAGFLDRLHPEDGVVADRGVAEERLGEVVHLVTLLRLDETVSEHGVVDRRAHGNALPKQDTDIELEVVSDLLDTRICKEFAKFPQHDFAFLARRHLDVSAVIGLPGKGDADDRGGLFVEGGRLEIETPRFFRFQFGDERGASRGIIGADRAVVFFEIGDGLELGDLGTGFTLTRGVPAAGLEAVAEEPLAKRVEFELDEERPQRLVMARADPDLIEGRRDRCVCQDGDELFREQGLLAVGLEGVLLLALEPVGLGEDLLERSEFGDELFGGLLADPGHARNIVGSVAPEPEHVDGLEGILHLPEFADLRLVEDLGGVALTSRLIDQGRIGHELGEILVGRDHVGDEVALSFGAFRKSADDVIGLPAGTFDHGDVEGLDEALHMREL